MPRFWPLPILLSLGAAQPAAALDSRCAISQHAVMRWDVRDLGSNSVHALLQARDGYVWIGTPAGLVRFDGARFVTFDSRSHASFGDGGVASLSEAADGALYLGTTSGGITRYDRGAFTRLKTPAGAGFVSALCSARNGTLWVGVHGRPMYRWKGNQADSFVTRPLGGIVNPLAIAEDAAGAIWFGTATDGLVSFDGRDFTRHPITADAVQALRFGRSGVLWVGTRRGLIRFHNGQRTLYSRRQGLLNENVTAVLEDRGGNVWVGTDGGLFRFVGERFTGLTSREGLSNDHVRCLLEDHEGNLWVGTADGLNCLSDSRFITYGRAEGLSDPAVTSTIGTSDGTVWIGTNSTSLARLQGGELREAIALPGGPGRGAITALHPDRAGGLWIAVDNGQLFHRGANVTADLTPTAPQRLGKIPLVFDGEDGPVFCVTGLGLARIEARRAVPLHPHAPNIGYAHAAYRDPEGTLWLGTSVGLVRVRGTEYKVFREPEGLPYHRVRHILGAPDGGLWLATIGGLAYFKDNRFWQVTTREGLPENYLRLVLDDGLGHLWVASMTRIFRLDKQELRELFGGRRTRVAPISFDATDGLRATESLLSNSPGFRGPDGRLWFATAQGLSVVDPAQISLADPAPQAVIERFNVDTQAAMQPEYPPGRGELTVEYTALSFRAPTKIRFRHRLEGFETDWTYSDGRRQAHYGTLPPGHYRFTVTASNRDGLWNGPATSWAFAIKPPFYQTRTFYVVCAAALLGLVLAAHRLRLGQIRARFRAVLHERTRIARELHDILAQGLAGVGIQIDTALSVLPEEERLKPARHQIELGCSMIRASLAEVRRSIWVLRAQTAKGAQDLPSALAESLRQLTADTQIALSFSTAGGPGPLDPTLESALLRIAHEAALNAVRHSGAGRISVALRFEPNGITLRVDDDGHGFDANQYVGQHDGQHFGLLGISERARALGGELRVASHAGAGTAVECRLPYASRPDDLDADHGEEPSL